MPFDGIVTKSIVDELKKELLGGRIEKIYQPERDEIILSIRSIGKNYKLLMSANASYPRIHFTNSAKDNPQLPPVFCMLLRKHLSSGKILDIQFHDFERIVTVCVESMNELGDIGTKNLIIEIMGRHSNIILTNSDNKILDSIKHVDNEISSVREVMPARPYVLPPSQDKTSPASFDFDIFIKKQKDLSDIIVEKSLLENIKGFSPVLCREICFGAGIDSKKLFSELTAEELFNMKKSLQSTLLDIEKSSFVPCIVYNDSNLENPVDFHAVPLKQYFYNKQFISISEALDEFYVSKDRFERLKQKKFDVTKVLSNSIDRCKKKLAIQQEKLRDVADRDKLQLFGELITANIYCISPGLTEVSLLNYYSENEEYLKVPMDEHLSPQDNAQRYFKKYSKAKSTYLNTSKQIEESRKEMEYLESVQHVLDNSFTLQDIEEIRQELSEQSYMLNKKKKQVSKKKVKEAAPLFFKSSDGYEILVGKNNKQNDQLTLKIASSNDVWLHTKNIPGSHVIVKKQQGEIPLTTLHEAALLSAHHSKGKMSSNVEIDYTQVKNVKKPSGAKPGMVIYENYKTLVVNPEKDIVDRLKTL